MTRPLNGPGKDIEPERYAELLELDDRLIEYLDEQNEPTYVSARHVARWLDISGRKAGHLLREHLKHDTLNADVEQWSAPNTSSPTYVVTYGKLTNQSDPEEASD